MQYEPETYCLGKKHVWLLLQHVCKSTTHSILTCLVCKTTIFFGCCIQLGGIFRLSLLTWLTHYPSCWHRFECVYTCACDCVSVFLSIMFVMCSMPRYIKHQQLFLSLPVSIHCWLHVDILFLGLKHYYFFNITVYICFSVGFVYCYPFLTLAL